MGCGANKRAADEVTSPESRKDRNIDKNKEGFKGGIAGESSVSSRAGKNVNQVNARDNPNEAKGI